MLFIATFGLPISVSLAQDDDFNFLFESMEKKTNAPTASATVTKGKPDFAFGFEDGAKGQASDNRQQATAPRPLPAKTHTKVEEKRVEDVDAYRVLLKENLDLRNRISQAAKKEQEARKQNQRLAREVADLDQRLVESANKIQSLQQTRKETPDDDLEKILKLESLLSAAEAERKELGSKLTDVRKRIGAAGGGAITASAPAPSPVMHGPAEGTDRFRDLEAENRKLKDKLVDIESRRIKAEKERRKVFADSQKAEDKAEELENELKELRETLAKERQEKEKQEDLLRTIPELESKVTALETQAETSESLLSKRERQLQELKTELEIREERLRKAAAMQKMLAAAGTKVREKSDQEKRDMHYNMALVYAEKGMPHVAEREFLLALQLDPSDPDIYYNLGVLYEEELNNPRKAILHYKRYLKLNPYGSDIDTVRGWIRRLEMK